jgi:predicted XRE-type DNA-binding protein
MAESIHIAAGSGNVFADIGIANPEEALLKAVIAYTITRRTQERGLTQGGAARLLGVDQPGEALGGTG